MGKDRTRAPWADATTSMWRTCWPVLLPLAAAVFGAALGPGGAVARTVPSLVVIAGAALLAPGRFLLLCLTTLVCAAATWSGGSGLKTMGMLLTDGALTAPFVVAGRALWLMRRRAAGSRLATGSRLAVTARHGSVVQLDLDKSS